MRLSAKDVGECRDVTVFHQSRPRAVFLAETPDDLGAEDVDLAVQEPPAFGYLALLGGQAIGQLSQLLVAIRLDVDETLEGSIIHGAHTLTIEVPFGTFNLRWRYVAPEDILWRGRVILLR
jgi:hypothetical protein